MINHLGKASFKQGLYNERTDDCSEQRRIDPPISGETSLEEESSSVSVKDHPLQLMGTLKVQQM